jgi:hypothetical protein
LADAMAAEPAATFDEAIDVSAPAAAMVIAATPPAARRKTIERNVSVPRQVTAPARDAFEPVAHDTPSPSRKAADVHRIAAIDVKPAGDERIDRVVAAETSRSRARAIRDSAVSAAHDVADSPRAATSVASRGARAIDVSHVRVRSHDAPPSGVDVRATSAQSGAPVVVAESGTSEVVTNVPQVVAERHVVEALRAEPEKPAERRVVTSSHIVPSERTFENAPASQPSSRNEKARSEPRVHIGVVEIVVAAPAEARPVAAAPAPSSNLASRRYLRSL